MGASVAFMLVAVILKTNEVLSGADCSRWGLIPHLLTRNPRGLRGIQACQLKAGAGSLQGAGTPFELTGADPGLLSRCRRRVTGGAADLEIWWLQAGAASLLPGVPQPALLWSILQTMPSVPGEHQLHYDFNAGAHPDPSWE